jgi:hypothetical protein
LHKGEFSITAVVTSLKDAKNLGCDFSVRATGHTQQRTVPLHELLQVVTSSMHLPWIVNGDFNLVLDPADFK